MLCACGLSLKNTLLHWTYSVGTLDKGMAHIPGGTEHNSTRFHHATPNGMPFKTYDLFIAVIFHLLFSEHSWLQATETVESKPWIRATPGTTIVRDLTDCKWSRSCFYKERKPFLTIPSKKTEDASKCHTNSSPGSSSHSPGPRRQLLSLWPGPRPLMSSMSPVWWQIFQGLCLPSLPFALAGIPLP